MLALLSLDDPAMLTLDCTQQLQHPYPCCKSMPSGLVCLIRLPSGQVARLHVSSRRQRPKNESHFILTIVARLSSPTPCGYTHAARGALSFMSCGARPLAIRRRVPLSRVPLPSAPPPLLSAQRVGVKSNARGSPPPPLAALATWQLCPWQEKCDSLVITTFGD